MSTTAKTTAQIATEQAEAAARYETTPEIDEIVQQGRVNPLLPVQAQIIVSTALVAANVAAAILSAPEHDLGYSQAARLVLAKHSIESSPMAKDADEIVLQMGRMALSVANDGLKKGLKPTRQQVAYYAVQQLFTRSFGQQMTVTGWLRGHQTSCMDTDGVYRIAKLTGDTCPECTTNPVVAARDESHARCLNQRECGWKAQD